MNSRGTVSIAFTIGFGNNLFQYCFSRLLAEKNNLEVVHRGIPEMGIAPSPPSLGSIDNSLPTVVVNDHNYKKIFHTQNLTGYNVVVNGYFEDHKIFKPHLEEIRGWFPRVERTNTKDVIIHLRLQNRLIQEAHNKNHISAHSIKEVIGEMDHDRVHIVTDAEKWEIYTKEDIERIQEEIRSGPNPTPEWVSTEQSLEYANHLIEGLSSLNPVVHCSGAKVIEKSGGLRSDFLGDFNLLRSFDKVVIHNSTFSWWAAALSGASQVAVFSPWKIAKPRSARRNLGETNFPGWFSWGGADALYFKEYEITE